MKKLLEQLQSPNLISIKGMKPELGWTTERKRLKNLSPCEDWIRNKPKHSIRLSFDNTDEFFDFK